MENICKNENEFPNCYKVISIRVVDDYIFVETNKTSLVIDKNKNVYDVGKYIELKKVYQMGNDLVAVLENNSKQDLVNLKTKEIYLSHMVSYYSGIWKIDDDYVKVYGPDYNKKVFNIRTKKFIDPDLDIPVEYSMKIGLNLFLYENNNYQKQIYQHFVINQDGRLIYDCGAYFPYFTDGNLIMSLSKEDKIAIVRDVYSESKKIEMINKNEFINSNPLIHENEAHKADSICFISGAFFIICDLNMNIIKKLPLDIDYDEVEIQLSGDMAVIIVKKNDESYCIGLNIKTGVQVKHQGIWILPLDVPGPTVVRGCDVLGDEDFMFTLYDENGNEYTHHRANDCFNIHNRNMNLYGFYGVDGTDNCLVYNVDTREEMIVPWSNPKFGIDANYKYNKIGFGIRYGESWTDKIIDFFDEDFNVVIEGIVAKDYAIKEKDFSYDLKNNLLLLNIPVIRGSATYFRKVVLDKNKNKLYDSFDNHLSFVGNFLQIVDEDNSSTYYIDSRTGEKILDSRIQMSDVDLPDTFKVNGKVIKLIKKNEDVYSE